MLDPKRVQRGYEQIRQALFAERSPRGYWTGELSASALSTATAIAAIALVQRHNPQGMTHSVMIARGLTWLARHQNSDGGWGDTIRSFSNLSTSLLVQAALHLCDAVDEYPEELAKLERYLAAFGNTPAERAEAVRRRYGKDRTFSVPILTMAALAGLVPWNEVPRLPFELASLPQSWYRFARLPVVSYALPALIAIGQCVHHHRSTWNPLTRLARSLSRERTLRVLQRIQPSSGGYLEAAPLTSFVTMSLASIGQAAHPVAQRGVDFLVNTVRPDGSWPIDTNLSIWLTTLTVNALSAAGDLESLDRREELLRWLLEQQTQSTHPFTGAEPGAWGWSDEPGSVPDCDDTPGAILAVLNLSDLKPVLFPIVNGLGWIDGLQNGDGGFPTFCRGWGTLPFDRSGSDLTAHAVRAFAAFVNQVQAEALVRSKPAFPPDKANRWLGSVAPKAFRYLERQQRSDGSWLPLWFGNQHVPDDANPVYGTSRVLAAYRDLNRGQDRACRRGVDFLMHVQNPDGGWGGAKNAPSTMEETALALEVLWELATVHDRPALENGVNWLLDAVEKRRWQVATPIGFYFAKLWYFEKLYPLIFTLAALGRVRTTA